MKRKPSYQELEQKIRSLESKCKEYKLLKDQELLENESLYTTLFDNLNDGVFVHPVLSANQPGCFIRVNDAACRMLGYIHEEFAAMTPWDLNDPETSSIYIPEVMQELLAQKTAIFEATQVTKQGQKIYVEVNANFCSFKGEDYIVSVVRDITERKQRVEALNRKNEEQALLLESIPAQIWHLTDIQTYGAVNQAHADFLGLSKEEIEYKSLHHFGAQDIVQSFNKNNLKVFLSKSKIYYEDWIENAQGEQCLMAITQIPRLNKDIVIQIRFYSNNY